MSETIESIARAFHNASQTIYRHYGMIPTERLAPEWDSCPWAYRHALILTVEVLVEEGYIKVGRR